MNKKIRILLALDPLTGSRTLNRNVSEFLSKLKKKARGDIEVQPVYVEVEPSNPGFSWSYGFPPRGALLKGREKKVHKMCKEISKASGLSLSHPVTLHSKGSSNEKAVDEIVEFSKDYDPHFSISLNQSKSFLSRVVLGSFTEELVDRMDSPVMVIGRKTQFNDFKRMLFCSQYRENDPFALECADEIAEQFSLGITVFNSLQTPYDSVIADTDFLAGESYLNVSRGQRKLAQIRAEDLIEDAHLDSKKNDIDIEIDEESTSVTEALLGKAMAANMMIVMPVGSWKSFWEAVGSTWRPLIKKSPVPVLLIGPLAIERIKKSKENSRKAS